MKPSTKLQHQINELSNRLPEISEQQKDWAFEKCFKKHFVLSRKTIFCLECGHAWKDNLITTAKKTECPNCNKKLTSLNYQNNMSLLEYFSIIDTVEDYQVVRMFAVKKYVKKGQSVSYFISEVMRHFIDENGKKQTLSKSVQGLSIYYDLWVFSSDLEFRTTTAKSLMRDGLCPAKIYPKIKVLKILKRNGFKGSCRDISPLDLFTKILTDSYAETLLKCNQIDALRYYCSKGYFSAKYLMALKICVRNNYIIKDFSIWTDYIDLLEYFKKDLRNAKFVCPADLHKSHDRLVKKKRDIRRKEKFANLKNDLEKNQAEYTKDKSKYFGIQFKEKNVSIKVIETVEEFLEEGETHNHCVFTNEYFKKPDSLVLSATVGKKRVETIEISLSEMRIKQARGAGNKATKYNSQIKNLVNKNLHKISSITNKIAV